MLRSIVLIAALVWAVLVWAALAWALPAAAHHGVSGYDMDRVLTIEGTVAAWHWRSPHTGLTLVVQKQDGMQTWEIEGAPLRWMQNQGFDAHSLQAGDRVAITYHPSRRAPQAGILMHVDRADGSRLSVNRPARLGGP